MKWKPSFAPWAVSFPVRCLLSLALLSCVSVGWAESTVDDELSPDPGLAVLEQNVLGRKYVDESEENRVQRLESSLKAPKAPATSLDYRKQQLYRLQETASNSHNKQLAIVAYNDGIDFTNQGHNTQAIEAYRRAIQLDGALVPAYNNLANLLLQNNQYEETIQLYQHAIAMQPDDPLLHRNMGILYEKMGKMQDAIDAYTAYLKRATQPDPPIQAIVDNYRNSRASGRASQDYVSATTRSSQGHQLIWPARNNPIKVFIKPEHPDQLFVIPIIQKTLVDWTQATDGRLRFTQVLHPQEANISITLQEGPLSDPTQHIGRAEYQMPEDQLSQNRLNFVTVTLNTGDPQSLKNLPEDSRREQIYRMTLHELGHAIGIWGHSTDPGDIMFAHPIASKLSDRDIRTIRKLYGI